VPFERPQRELFLRFVEQQDRVGSTLAVGISRRRGDEFDAVAGWSERPNFGRLSPSGFERDVIDEEISANRRIGEADIYL
jgi:hypothetical protein